MQDQRESMWAMINRRHAEKVERLEKEEELASFLKHYQNGRLTHNPFKVLKK